jgi:hypothetical protein
MKQEKCSGTHRLHEGEGAKEGKEEKRGEQTMGEGATRQ